MQDKKSKKKELLSWAGKLYERFLVAGNSGNISARLDKKTILITCRGAYLGFLDEDDLLLIDNQGAILEGKKETSIETPIHLAVYKRFPANCLIHAHPNFTNAYFAQFSQMKYLSIETKVYLSKIKVVAQATLTVTELEPVLNALEHSNIVVLKDHGVLSKGSSFKQAFSYIDYLEEAAKVNFLSIKR